MLTFVRFKSPFFKVIYRLLLNFSNSSKLNNFQLALRNLFNFHIDSRNFRFFHSKVHSIKFLNTTFTKISISLYECQSPKISQFHLHVRYYNMKCFQFYYQEIHICLKFHLYSIYKFYFECKSLIFFITCIILFPKFYTTWNFSLHDLKFSYTF